MKYCSRCGNGMEDDMLFCQKCGAKDESFGQRQQAGVCDPYSEAYQYENFNTQKAPRKKTGTKFLAVILCIFMPYIGIFYVLIKKPFDKKSNTIWIIWCLIMVVAVIFIMKDAFSKDNDKDPHASAAIVSPSTEKENEQSSEPTEKPISVIVDVTQFANLSGQELTSLLGQPDEINEGTCSGVFDVPCVYYEYEDSKILGYVSFVLVKDTVVRLTSEKQYPYDRENVLDLFGIEKGEKATLIADTDIALRYRCPSEKVDDLWINQIENDTFAYLQVTYEMVYYEEWYLPLTLYEESDYQYWTQNNVKSILKTPKTANFPNLNDWAIVKNPFYVAVQSYVDAENSLGVKIRSNFSFIYLAGTDKIVYAVFDGDVIADNGYVPTEELIIDLASKPG